MTRVLFLCSSNRYRSRFAEHSFNWLVKRDGLRCRAISRGLSVGRWPISGPISMRAVEGLKARGIPIPSISRCPQQVSEADLAWADLIVALQESEHRAAMENLFPLGQSGGVLAHRSRGRRRPGTGVVFAGK